jgi:hypothetical protein
VLLLPIAFNTNRDHMRTRTKMTIQPGTTSTLMPIAVDVDLVRIEKNLLR